MAAYQLRIQLRGISRAVWRRILIDGDTTIAELHDVIQRCMGWEDNHLHHFLIRGRWFNRSKPGGIHFGGSDLKLSEFDLRVHERFAYEYDFYSHWEHEIRVERVLDSNDPASALPLCLAGRGACPPEDSGPPSRYMETMRSWRARAFDCQAANARLQEYDVRS